MMNTLIIREGFEVMMFRWDQLPAFVRGFNRGADTPQPTYAALHVAAQPREAETFAVDEDPERWDGLS